MITSGILKVSSGVSRLNGTRLAIVGDPDPFGAATDFLANRGLSPNDFIWVDGTDDFVGNVPVNNITDAGPVAPALIGAAATKALSVEAKKAFSASAKKSGGKKKGISKKAAAGKKGGAKKRAKKSASKKSGKGARKRQ
jgi:hypothetical protein